MIPSIEFSKVSGCGNDFICIDNRDGRYDEMLISEHGSHFVRAICHRGFGVGADGVVFAGRTGSGDGVDIFARFFEPDGSEAELCGNGAGCFIYWVVANGWVPDREIRVLTFAGVARGHRSDGKYVRVCIPLPTDMEQGFEIETDGQSWQCDFLVTGVPHLVCYVDDVDQVNVPLWGPAIRWHERFQPRGVNANFVQVLDEGSIAVRTFEFGVEGETLACGTGSAAAAILAAGRFGWQEDYSKGHRPVDVRSHGGDILKIWFTRQEDGSVVDVCLETVVRPVFKGVVDPALAAEVLADPRDDSALSVEDGPSVGDD